jgi:hypothetical protein
VIGVRAGVNRKRSSSLTRPVEVVDVFVHVSAFVLVKITRRTETWLSGGRRVVRVIAAHDSAGIG